MTQVTPFYRMYQLAPVFYMTLQVTSEKGQSNNEKINDKKVQENTNLKRSVQPSTQPSSGTVAHSLYLSQQMTPPLEGII